MSRTIVSADALPKASPYYSHAVKCAGLVFVSGTTAYHVEDGRDRGRDDTRADSPGPAEHRGNLKAAGTTLDKAVSATVLLAYEDDFPGMNEEWVKWFPTDPPARHGAKLPRPNPQAQGLDRDDRRGVVP